jgi:hypothetical protein
MKNILKKSLLPSVPNGPARAFRKVLTVAAFVPDGAVVNPTADPYDTSAIDLEYPFGEFGNLMIDGAPFVTNVEVVVSRPPQRGPVSIKTRYSVTEPRLSQLGNWFAEV